MFKIYVSVGRLRNGMRNRYVLKRKLINKMLITWTINYSGIFRLFRFISSTLESIIGKGQ